MILTFDDVLRARKQIKDAVILIKTQVSPYNLLTGGDT